MVFNEKLDFLMNLTKTTNSSLALYTSLDASYISRLRRGKRCLPKNENYVIAMSSYFSRQFIEDYQKKALRNVLNNDCIFSDEREKIDALIYSWLIDDRSNETQSVKNFLDQLSNSNFNKVNKSKNCNDFCDIQMKETPTSIYYGIEGKREAVIAFLLSILCQEEPQTLMLFSDEDMEWLTGDREYTAQWAELMFRVIKKGNKINIIHTVSRNLDEMLNAISGWMTLYMTGAIEPYYYPKKRDGIFKRTLFIAPETAAVIATSVGDMEANAANFLLKDKKAISAITKEYTNYFCLCKPLIHIYTPTERNAYLRMLHDFERQASDTILKAQTLSLVTMPKSVAESIVGRYVNNENSSFMNYFNTRKQIFEDMLDKNSFTEIINLPNTREIIEGKVKVDFSEMILSEEIYYKKEEFKLHIQNIIDLLQGSENYNLILIKNLEKYKYMLYAKEDYGVIVAKTTAPYIILSINESNMTAAFWDFLNDNIYSSIGVNFGKHRTISILKDLVDELK